MPLSRAAKSFWPISFILSIAGRINSERSRIEQTPVKWGVCGGFELLAETPVPVLLPGVLQADFATAPV